MKTMSTRPIPRSIAQPLSHIAVSITSMFILSIALHGGGLAQPSMPPQSTPAQSVSPQAPQRQGAPQKPQMQQVQRIPQMQQVQQTQQMEIENIRMDLETEMKRKYPLMDLLSKYGELLSL